MEIRGASRTDERNEKIRKWENEVRSARAV